MKRRNPVAKHGRRFNTGGAHEDKRRKAMYKDIDNDDYDFEEEEDIVICPSCGTEQAHSVSHIGNLGVIEHHRCRHCGFDFQYRPEED